jgi:hypothetical protein
MADFGIGETIALSAALGAGSAAMKNQDPLRGALIGGVLGGATAGIGSAFGAAGSTVAPEIASQEIANIGGVEASKEIIGEQATNSLLNQPMDASRGMVEPSVEEGIKQLGQNAANAAPSSNIPYDPMQASQEGYRLNNAVPQAPGLNTAPPPVASKPSIFDKGYFDQSKTTLLGDAPLSTFNKGAAMGVASTLTPMFNTSNNKYGVPPVEHYNGPLNYFKYNPQNYTPLTVSPNPVYKPSYAGYAFAEGGIAQLKDHIYHPSYEGYAGAPQTAQQIAPQNSGAYPMGNISTPTRNPVAAQQFNPMLIPHNPMWQAEQDRIAAEAAANAPASYYGNYDSGGDGGGGGGDGGGGEKAGGLINKYAAGGIAQLPQTNFAIGGSAPLMGTPAANTTMDSTVGNNAMFPMSEMGRSYYATPTQMPAGIANSKAPQSPQSAAGTTGGYEAQVTPYDGTMSNNFAGGGIAGLLRGQGDGMSDDIHATIGGSQPARLADGEFVIPADVVSHLGNGSTDAGAKHLYAMMDKVRKARTGRKAQGKQIKAGGYLPA